MLAAMLHNAMPVLRLMDDPERGGMLTPGETRTLIASTLAPILDNMGDVPETSQIRTMFITFGESLEAAMNSALRRQGRLMTESGEMGAPTPAPEAGKD